MKRLLLFLFTVLCFVSRSSAEEGMWLVPLIDQNQNDMKSNGLELLPRNINGIQPAGKAIGNSVVMVGGGCTGSVISPNGLVLTNHHCAYSYIHNMSTMDNNILRTGFWATGNSEDIPVPGLTVTFVRYMGNVTADILNGVDSGLNKEDREYTIERNKNTLLMYYQNQYQGENYKFAVTNYFDGEFYILTITQTYPDIRLVGIPPESIGNFGGEASNWQWPRYRGDFALFRIYTAPDGSPADYSDKNVPYTSKAYLKISPDDYRNGDFAMVLGFPGSTLRYIPESEVKFFIETNVKPSVDVNGVLLDIMKKEMDQNEDVSFKYGPKYSMMSNSYLKYRGMLDGLEKYGVYEGARARDEKFKEWADRQVRKKDYANTLMNVSNYNNMHGETSKAREYVYDAFVNGIDLLSVAQRVNRFRASTAMTPKSKERLTGIVQSMYKNYDAAVDRKLAYEAIKTVVDKVPAELLPADFKNELDIQFKGDVKAYVDYLYNRTGFSSPQAFMAQWEDMSPDRWAEDPAIRLLISVQNALKTLDAATVNSEDNGAMLQAYRTASADYANGLKALGIIKYPNAGRNMRLTYGTVDGYSTPERGTLDYFTTLDQMMGLKNDDMAGLPRTFTELYAAKDSADYAAGQDTIKVNFLTSTDVTGGNSGSPVLDSKGNIIGIVFDNNREALTGDLSYNGDVNRTINVDIRYILYVIGKYAGAQGIIDEITFAPKTNDGAPAPFEPEFKY